MAPLHRPTHNVLYAIPFYAAARKTWTRISIDVTTGAGGANARLGIFTCGPDGAPGTLILDAGQISVATTGVKEITISQALEVGYYHLVVVSDGTPTLRAQPGSVQNSIQYAFIGTGTPGTFDNTVQRSFTYGALSGASPFGTPTFINGQLPQVYLRVV